VAFLVSVPCIIFEDEHLLVINKPAGMNTHAPSPFAGEGIYDWLRHREPRWARLAIMHRLDKETSGVLAFSKTEAANRSLTAQFANHTVRKTYLLVTDRPVSRNDFTVRSALVRAGEKYVARPAHAGSGMAETRFRVRQSAPGKTVVEAKPVTGKTHQIRVHAAESGFPVLGDALYGGTPAARVHLHAQALALRHPATGEAMTFAAPENFSADPRVALRSALVDQQETNAFRLAHGAADGRPDWYVDRLGDFLLSQAEHPLTEKQRDAMAVWLKSFSLRGACHKTLLRRVREARLTGTSPQEVFGARPPGEFSVRENGLRFALSFNEGYSVGLFLDQRDNRRRFLINHVAADFPLFGDGLAGAEVLNTFAYTCGFSVCAAKAGARTTSLDLSQKYLEWGKRNFALNGLDAAGHDFIRGDVFDWLRRLVKRQRPQFDVVVLDPPTFSQSKGRGTFQAEKDFCGLVAAALPVLKPNGVLLASTNAAKLAPENFLSQVTSAIASVGRKILRSHYVPQPSDFPITRAEPAYLKTHWLKVA
jgi:23S rRNA (cytosine1962-C5)-methyltransferase